MRIERTFIIIKHMSDESHITMARFYRSCQPYLFHMLKWLYLMIWEIDSSLTVWSIKRFSKISFPNLFVNDFYIFLGYLCISFAIWMLLISILRRFYIFLVLALLEDKQQFIHGGVWHLLNIYIISGSFCHIFRRIMCFKLPFMLLFLIYAWVWLFDVFCKILDHFD